MSERTCATCHAELPPSAGRGRPRIYCGDECRMSTTARLRAACSSCGKVVYFGPASAVDRICRPCRTLASRTKRCPNCVAPFIGRTKGQRFCSVECANTFRRTSQRSKSNAERRSASQLNSRARRRLNDEVRSRTDSPLCALCEHPIDRGLRRSGRGVDPLSSCIDDWLPRSLGGDPLDPANLVEMHRICNGIKGAAWPVTDPVRTAARSAVMRVLEKRRSAWPALVETPYAQLFQSVG